MGMNGPRKLRAVIPSAESIEDLDNFKLAEDENLSKFEPPLVMYINFDVENLGTSNQDGMKD